MRICALLLACCTTVPAQDQASPPAPKLPEVKESVVVTGVYDPVPLEEADRAVRVFDLDAAQKLLSNTVFDYLRLDPSLDVQSRAPNGVQTDLSIRGGDFAQTLVLLDGIRLNDVQSAHHDLDIPLPPDALGRVEILQGAGSALYGSDAEGGVVNLITGTPESNELHLRTSVGNFGVNQQSGSLTTVWDQITEQLSFSRDFSTGFMEDRDYRNLSFASITHLRTVFGKTDVTLAMSDKPFGANQFYGDYNSWERTRTWFAALHQSLGKNTDVSFAFRRHTDLFVLIRDQPQLYTNRHAVEGYQAALRRHNRLRKNTTFSYGAEGFREVIDSTNQSGTVIGPALGSHQRNHGAAYVAMDVRALKRFSFTLGAREEIYGGGARQFNPTASAGYWLSSHWKLRASASRAFRFPTYTDLYYQDPGDLGNPNLKPETTWSYDGGVEWNAGGRIRWDAVAFNRRERNGIDYVRASPSDPWQATNFDRLYFTGVETSVSIRASKTQSIQIGYTGLHGAEDMLMGLESKYVFNYPTHDGVVSWQATLPKGILARSRVGAVKVYQRDPYAVWDLYLAKSFGKWTPFAQFTNLTSTQYQEVVGVAMPGRAAVVGIDWKFGW